MRRIILTSLLALVLQATAYGGVSIISDLDDTIKITNSGNFLEAFFYGTSKRRVYHGFPQFLALSREYVTDVSVVTASPKILKYNIKRLIRRHDLQIDNLVLNRNINRPSKFDFKVNAIKKIIDSSANDFILIGDDVGEDPEIYDEIMKLYPQRILASYIHVIRNRKIPESNIRYWTTFELAVREYQKNRFSTASAKSIINLFEGKDSFEGVFPDFAHCPKKKKPFKWLLETEFSAESERLMKRMKRYCRLDWDD